MASSISLRVAFVAVAGGGDGWCINVASIMVTSEVIDDNVVYSRVLP